MNATVTDLTAILRTRAEASERARREAMARHPSAARRAPRAVRTTTWHGPDVIDASGRVRRASK